MDFSSIPSPLYSVIAFFGALGQAEHNYQTCGATWFTREQEDVQEAGIKESIKETSMEEVDAQEAKAEDIQ